MAIYSGFFYTHSSKLNIIVDILLYNNIHTLRFSVLKFNIIFILVSLANVIIL